MRLPSDLAHHGLYDGTGRHLGGFYQSVMIDGQLTPAVAALMAHRPVAQMFWDPRVCADPAVDLSLVWFLPVEANPLATALDVIPYLVQAVDAGQSVKLLAAGRGELDQLCAFLSAFVGGGHA